MIVEGHGQVAQEGDAPTLQEDPEVLGGREVHIGMSGHPHHSKAFKLYLKILYVAPRETVARGQNHAHTRNLFHGLQVVPDQSLIPVPNLDLHITNGQ